MTIRNAMWRLAIIWLVGSGAIFLVLGVQSLRDYYEPKTDLAWGWFLPTVMPTLSLIVATLVREHRAGTASVSDLGPFDLGLYRLAYSLSCFYMVVIAVSVLVYPLMTTTTPPLEVMQRSNLWLGPLQGLTVAALGFLYGSNK